MNVEAELLGEVILKLLIIPVALVAFAAGFILHPAIESVLMNTFGVLQQYPTSIKGHWRKVEHYKEFLKDPANMQSSSGYSYMTPPYDPIPHLNSLAAAHELEYVDLIFPNVPNKKPALDYVLKWADQNEDIVYFEGNVTYQAYPTSGEQPLQLKIWFKDSAKADVQKMIKDIEALPKE